MYSLSLKTENSFYLLTVLGHAHGPKPTTGRNPEFLIDKKLLKLDIIFGSSAKKYVRLA
jgi:hypothetical protein